MTDADAALIEQLREEQEACWGNSRREGMFRKTADRLASLVAENDGLHKALRENIDKTSVWIERCNALNAELAEANVLAAECVRLNATLSKCEEAYGKVRHELAALKTELEESRANDRTAMGYLSGIRNALGFDGNFPALVEHCAALKAELAEAMRRIDSLHDALEIVKGDRDTTLEQVVALKVQSEPVGYTWPTVADYEKDVGFTVNAAFVGGWNMARTTNRMLGFDSPQPSAEVERDAERYRWLRDESIGQWEHPIAVSQTRSEIGMRYVGPLIGKELDAAIDAAMRKGE